MTYYFNMQSFCEQFDPLELVSKKPHTVVLMLDSPEEHVLQSACEALYKFSEKCEFAKLQLGITGLKGQCHAIWQLYKI